LDLHRQPSCNHEDQNPQAWPRSGDIVLAHINTELAALKCTLTIQWVPGHTDVAGNEKADELAKLATTQRPPATFRTSISYLKRVARAKAMSEWREWWDSTPPSTLDRSARNPTKSLGQQSCASMRTIVTITCRCILCNNGTNSCDKGDH